MGTLKKIFLVIVLCLSLLTPTFSQSTDIRSEFELLTNYQTLLVEHEELLDDYEELLNNYETLLVNYNSLKNEYGELSVKFERLTYQHALDIKFHEETKLSLIAANRVIESLEVNVRQLLTIADVRYFAVYPQVGYAGNVMTAGFGFTAQYPKFPLALMFDVDYIHGIEFPVNIQVGIGFRF
jgi:hypothetical protein